METNNQINTGRSEGQPEFHAVEFMRQIRVELTDQFLNDKQAYLDYLKKTMDEFKAKQRKVHKQLPV